MEWCKQANTLNNRALPVNNKYKILVRVVNPWTQVSSTLTHLDMEAFQLTTPGSQPRMGWTVLHQTLVNLASTLAQCPEITALTRLIDFLEAVVAVKISSYFSNSNPPSLTRDSNSSNNMVEWTQVSNKIRAPPIPLSTREEEANLSIRTSRSKTYKKTKPATACRGTQQDRNPNPKVKCKTLHL